MRLMRPFKGTFLCSDKELESQQTSLGWCAHLNRIKAQSICGSVPGMPPAWIQVMTGEQSSKTVW